MSKNNAAALAVKHPALARPLYAFDLPAGLHDSLRLRSRVGDGDASQMLLVPGVVQHPDPKSKHGAEVTHGGQVPACTICPGCGAFSNVSAQRRHFRSDWHRYNVQLNVHRVKCLVDQHTFERFCEEVESETETETETETEGEGEGEAEAGEAMDVVGKILSRTLSQSRESRLVDGMDAVGGESVAAGDGLDSMQMKAQLLWFVSKDSANEVDKLRQTQLGFHRNAFPDPGTNWAPPLPASASIRDWYAACIASMQVGRITRQASNMSLWKAKRIKSKEVQEAAKSMLMSVLDGEGFIPDVSTSIQTECADTSSDENQNQNQTANSGSDNEADESRDESVSTIMVERTRQVNVDPPLRMWTILLLGGGHFAASVIALNPHVTTYTTKPGDGTNVAREHRSLILLAHKTFHRYTTRRKQGGSQAAQDATGRYAKSAGAQLRRYNQAALGEDVRTLLDSRGWRLLISRSDKVWVRAGARAARGLLWSWEAGSAKRVSPVEMARDEGRVGTLPFPTRRATIGETVRCFLELAKVKVQHKTEEQLGASEEEALEQMYQKTRKQNEAKRREEKAREKATTCQPSLRSSERGRVVKLSDKEQAERTQWKRLVEMVRKNRTEALLTFLSKNETDLLDANIDVRLPAWMLEEQVNQAGATASASRLIASTLLQVAAEAGSESVTRYLLEERNANPTLCTERLGQLRTRFSHCAPTCESGSTEVVHRTAYDLCSSKEVRNVFRRMMAVYPDRWEWGGMGSGGGRVPSGLTEEMEENQTSKQKDRRAAMREKARERANKCLDKCTLQPSSTPPRMETQTEQTTSWHHTTNRLGAKNVVRRSMLKPRDEEQALTHEMRARIEREKRARAAEERMKAVLNR